jgi:hypothetical protein
MKLNPFRPAWAATFVAACVLAELWPLDSEGLVLYGAHGTPSFAYRLIGLDRGATGWDCP